jgi:predicted RND superfamily exporter protein
VSVVIYCYPPAGTWRQGASPGLRALLADHPGAILTGPNIVSAELRRIVWDDAMRAAALGFVLVFALMWADLGSVVKALLGLAPLLVGMVWMLGAMALLGLKLNFFNVFVLTMIIGIGVDYGVHLLHRWEESAGDPAAVAETAKAIAVAGLTTMVGFGSVVLSHYPGLRSVGAAAILGASSTAVLGMTLLPVLLARWRAAGRNDDSQARG